MLVAKRAMRLVHVILSAKKRLDHGDWNHLSICQFLRLIDCKTVPDQNILKEKSIAIDLFRA